MTESLILVLVWFITTVIFCFRMCYDECKMIELESKIEKLEKEVKE